MGRWVEVSAGRKKWAEGEPSEEDVAIGSSRMKDMIAAARAPIASIWNPRHTVPVVGHEVPTKRDWERLKKERGIIEVSPRDSSMQGLHAKPKFDPRAAAQQAVENALKKAQAGELPPAPPPKQHAPPPVKSGVVTPEQVRQEAVYDESRFGPIGPANSTRHEDQVSARTADIDAPIMPSGERAYGPDDAVRAMMRRNGWA